jgi:nicotinate-nucleotide adenylyltransferase
LEQCHFIVISRPGYDLRDAKKILRGKYTKRMIQVLDSAKLDKMMQQSCKIFLLSIPALDIASKDIRIKVKKGESIAGLVAESVEEYIRINRLYQ